MTERNGFLGKLAGLFGRRAGRHEAATADEVLAEMDSVREDAVAILEADELPSGADGGLGEPDPESGPSAAGHAETPPGDGAVTVPEISEARARIAGLIVARAAAEEPEAQPEPGPDSDEIVIEVPEIDTDPEPEAALPEDGAVRTFEEAAEEAGETFDRAVETAAEAVDRILGDGGEADETAEASGVERPGASPEAPAVQADPSPDPASGAAGVPASEGPGLETMPGGAVSLLRADGTPMPRHRLGEFVLDKGLITPAQLDAASREQEVTGDRIGQILVSNGFLTDRDRVSAILATSSERIAQESVTRSRIPADLLDQYNIMISAETEDTVYVSSMYDEEIVEKIVEEYYGDKSIQFVSFLPTAMNGFIASMKKSSSIDDASQTKETMLDRTLYWALNEGASDIHVVPRRKSYTIFFRMLGVRRIVHEGPLDEFKTMIAQIKDRARMDLAERRKPQDGGFQIEYSGKMIDLRVATLPAAEGEVCVMRVLDPDRVQPSLSQLGLTDVEKWRKGFSQQHGLCLICGPTGSGKTTTLNASIKEMDRFGKSIYTVEDPVEYRIPYTGQISVNTSVGLNFATAVRAFMRADPDVIVLGEVRDEETARNAIKAADTGHMVLATLHTGSIQGAVSRLKDLGVAPRELRYLLRSVLVQSLVRTVCTKCHGAGCPSCKGDGYAGRTLVSECEYFEDSDQVDRLIDSSSEELVRTWPTMVEDALKKESEGITDLPELRRVFGAGLEPFLRKREESKTEALT